MHALHMNYKIARTDEMQLTHIVTEQEASWRSLLKRAYLSGFFDELFFMRWNWSSYKRFSVSEWLGLLKKVIYPIWPLASWLINIASLWGHLRARWFLINHQALISRISVNQDR